MPRQFDIPRLATVTVDTEDPDTPLVQIVLAPDYPGGLLNELEGQNPYDKGVLFCGDSAKAVNDPALACFMEVLSHWDHDHDGVPDADHVADAIEEALWEGRDATDEFERPNGGVFVDLLMRFMPPQPARHIVFGYGELKPRFRWYHYAGAIPLIIGFLALVFLQTANVPWLKYSVISGVGAMIENLGIIKTVLIIGAAFLVLRFALGDNGRGGTSLSKHTYGFFNKYAVYEEQAFREGSEHWSTAQRIFSCVMFGAIHMVNLFYPLSTILPLSIIGGLYMVVYLHNYRRVHFRRNAVLASSVFHRVYNRIALTLAVIVVLSSATQFVLGLFTLAGVWVTEFLLVKGHRRFVARGGPQPDTSSDSSPSLGTVKG